MSSANLRPWRSASSACNLYARSTAICHFCGESMQRDQHLTSFASWSPTPTPLHSQALGGSQPLRNPYLSRSQPISHQKIRYLAVIVNISRAVPEIATHRRQDTLLSRSLSRVTQEVPNILPLSIEQLSFGVKSTTRPWAAHRTAQNSSRMSSPKRRIETDVSGNDRGCY